MRIAYIDDDRVFSEIANFRQLSVKADEHFREREQNLKQQFGEFDPYQSMAFMGPFSRPKPGTWEWEAFNRDKAGWLEQQRVAVREEAKAAISQIAGEMNFDLVVDSTTVLAVINTECELTDDVLAALKAAS